VTSDDGSASVYNGTGWSSATDFDGTDALSSVSCPSATACVVLDEDRASFVYNGSSWSSSASLGDGTNVPVALSCRLLLCVAVDDHGHAIMGSST
jgi:hypothetical protein